MKHLRNLAVLVMMIVSAGTALAQKKGQENDYNLKKAYEVLREEKDVDKAMELVNKQLEATPKNANAYLLRARLYRQKEKFGNALSDINEAMKYNKPKETEVFASTLFWWKATIYYEMEDYPRAEEFYTKALAAARKDAKDNVQEISFKLGQTLFMEKKLSEADAVYRQMIKEDETDQGAIVGLARNMIEREEYQSAVDILLKGKIYDTDYCEIYRYLARAYDKMGETDKAIDAVLDYFDKDNDARTGYVVSFLKKHGTYAEAKIKVRRKSSDNKYGWDVLLTDMYEALREYEKAIDMYDMIESEYGKRDFITYYRADNYSKLGLFEQAVDEYMTLVGKGGSYDDRALVEVASTYRLMGRYGEARGCFSKVIDLYPDSAIGYYARGWCWELDGDEQKALDDYNAGIDIDKEYPYIFLMRGLYHKKRGNEEIAAPDFEYVLQVDTLAEDGSCRHYALQALGRNDEALEWMQKIIDEDPKDPGNLYDKSCLLARMGKLDESVAVLKEALELGYINFIHLEHDDDMDPIRDREDFKNLIADYSTKYAERIRIFLEKRKGDEKEGLITEVSINRHSGGTFEVPCTVNGLSLNMIFDTGASDVTISSVEANFMLKNGHLSKEDVKGKRYYQIANGDLSEGTIITLREVKVGDAVLKNVDASVVKSQKAPLLLGQSVMERFGTITIDNINQKLIIKQ